MSWRSENRHTKQWSAVASVAGSVLSSKMGSSSAKKAGQAQAQSAEAGVAEQRRQFDLTRKDLAPYQQAGVSALDQQLAFLGLPPSGGQAGAQTVNPAYTEYQQQLASFNAQSPAGSGLASGNSIYPGGYNPITRQAFVAPSTDRAAHPGSAPPEFLPSQPQSQSGDVAGFGSAFQQFADSPGQRFLRERQEKALLRNAAATGQLGGGNVRTALQEQAFGRGATQLGEFQNRLAALSGTGQTAATNLGQLGGQTAANIQSGLASAGQSRASGILTGQQAISQGISGAASAIGKYFDNK